jgi:integrase
MGRPKGSFGIPAYRLHKPSGRAVVTIADRTHYLPGKFGTRETSPESWREYDRLIGEYMLRGRQGHLAGDPRSVTVEQVAAAFWTANEARKDVRGEPHHRIKSALRWLRTYGQTPAAEFGPLKLKALRLLMTEARQRFRGGKLGAKLSRNYVNEVVRVVVRVFRWGVECEMVPGSVYHALTAVEPLKDGDEGRPTDPVKPVEQKDIDAVLRLASPTLAAMIQFQLHTGCRPGEMCSMRWCDVDTSGPVWRYRPVQHKTKHRGHNRVVFIGPQAQACVTPYMRAGLASHVFSPADSFRERFAAGRADAKWRLYGRRVSRGGTPAWAKLGHWTTDTYGGAVRRLVDRADKVAHAGRPEVPADVRIVARWHVHQLRHTSATLIRSRFGLDVAQAILGHRTAAMTELYAEKDFAKAMQAIAAAG